MTMTFGAGAGVSNDEDEFSAIGGIALSGGYDIKQARLVLGATPPPVILTAGTSPVFAAPPVVITDPPVPNTGSFAPVINSDGGGATAALSRAENTTAVTTVVASDADGNVITYSLNGGADASKFAINAGTGALTFITAPNFEVPTDTGTNNVYNVVVRASDGSLFDDQAIAVTITNVNDAPVITSNGGGATAAISMAENLTAVTSVLAIDAEGSPISYSLSLTGDFARFTINPATGELAFVTAPNFEAPTDIGANNVYDVVVRASDGGLFDNQIIAVTITNVIETAPVITSNGGGAAAAISLAENLRAVTIVHASDADGDPITYSLNGGADAGKFMINASTGALRFVAAPNFEAPTDVGANNVYDVVVRASDGRLFDDQTIAVTVTNFGPAIVSPTAVGFADDRTGTAYQAVATEASGLTLSWSLSGTDAARFNINAATGAVTFKAAPDYQAPTDGGNNNDYDITLIASGGPQVLSQDVTISVLPLGSFAPTIVSAASVGVPERTTATVYTAAATQPNGATTFHWTLSGADAAKFNLNAGNGAVSFKSTPSFLAPGDVGGNNIYDVIVTATDGTLSTSKAVAISVTDAPESTALANGLGGTAGFGTTSLVRADDTSVYVDIASVFEDGMNWFGTVYKSMWVNINGNVSFSAAVSGWQAVALPTIVGPLLAPYWGDVDTRGGVQTATAGGTSTGSNLVWYNVDSVNDVVTVTWDDVQVYGAPTGNPLNAFQLRIIARPEGSSSAGSSFVYGANTFDVEFRYEAINWVRGPASSGDAGIGWDGGNGVNFLNVPGSLTAAAGTIDTAAQFGQPTIGTVLLTNVGGVGLLPTITTAALAKAEGQTGTTPFSILLVRQGDLSLSATVDWSVTGTGVNAATAADFSGSVLPTGTLTFAAGASVATVNLQVAADRLAELDETFALTLSNASGATIVNTTTTMTIQRDESAPTITSGTSATIAENATGTAYQAAAVAADDTTSFVWTLGGTDAARFDINASTGAVSFKTPPNFEAPTDAGANNVYDITVTAADDTLTSSRAVAITVTDLVEPPQGIDDSLTIDEAATSADLTALLLGNDSNTGSAPVIQSVSTAGTIGTVSFDAQTQTLTYAATGFATLGQGDTGNDSFTYTFVGAGGLTATATVTLSITGLTTADVYGTPGTDLLNGRQYGAHMYGYAGDDTYAVVSLLDTVIELPGEGYDSVRTTLSTYVLPDSTEALVFSGSGDFHGIGNAGANAITGGNGDDILDGQTGPDVLTGGGGNDTYIIDYYLDQTIEGVDEGHDLVLSSIPWILAANVEDLTITGVREFAGTGNALDNVITGNGASNVLGGLAGNDTLIGNAGNDTLDGGSGADAMTGGIGDDLYRIDDGGDVITELFGEGTDSVQTVLNSLTLADNVDNLTFTGSGDFVGTGNALANAITGGAGSDILDGGIGSDRLTGGAGNDTYRVDDAFDVVIEKSGAGTDTIEVTASSYTLPAYVERLVYVGNGDFTGTGSSGNDTMTGGGGNDYLSGGLGVDVLDGGAGNDTLLGGNANDRLDGGLGADVLFGGNNNDIFVLSKAGANGDAIADFTGNGRLAGDTLLLTGWGAGSTAAQNTGLGVLVITDGIDGYVAVVTVAGAIHATDIMFG